MIQEYSILHISDLHKKPDCNYDSLFMSLRIDCDNYTSMGIQKPSIIVVSGDLIEGSKQPDKEDAIEEIKRQYAEVRAFLLNLVGYFLDGDKRRLIIVPGNHDVCQAISKESMIHDSQPTNQQEAVAKRKDLVNKNNRWNWKDLTYYAIQDSDTYKSRFDLFVEFYNDFFSDLNPVRIWKNPCEENSQIIDLPDYRICFIEFNSCYRLDHLNDSGEIHPNALTCHQNRITQIYNRGSLIVGVWHHHTSGLPFESNYLDFRILQSMIGMGVRIGLYGHQHVTTILNEYSDLNLKEKILLVSSGSLYGGRNQLVTGCPRQYCLISLKYSIDKVEFKLHVRKDGSNFDIPNWTVGTIGSSASTEAVQNIRLKSLNIEKLISETDSYAQSSKDYEQAYLMMKELMPFNPEVCTVYADKYLHYIDNPDFLISNINPPSSDNEYTYLLSALINKRDVDGISMLMQDDRFIRVKGGLMNYLREEAKKLVQK